MSPYEKNSIENADGMYYEVWCDSCQSSGQTCLTKEEAINSWNSRV